MLKAFFGLPLRALDGFINSIFQLMETLFPKSVNYLTRHDLIT